MADEDKKYPLPSKEVLEAIKENVVVVKTVLSKQLDVNLDLDDESIKWIEVDPII